MLGLRTVIYKVGNIEEAKSWYELGLQPEEQPIIDKTESVTALWDVEDIHLEFGRLLGLGATIYETPNNVGGKIVVASVKDPWGNILGLIYNPEFKLP